MIGKGETGELVDREIGKGETGRPGDWEISRPGNGGLGNLPPLAGGLRGATCGRLRRISDAAGERFQVSCTSQVRLTSMQMEGRGGGNGEAGCSKNGYFTFCIRLRHQGAKENL